MKLSVARRSVGTLPTHCGLAIIGSLANDSSISVTVEAKREGCFIDSLAALGASGRRFYGGRSCVVEGRLHCYSNPTHRCSPQQNISYQHLHDSSFR